MCRSLFVHVPRMYPLILPLILASQERFCAAFLRPFDLRYGYPENGPFLAFLSENL
jgi:hypothetical protein